jgi:hypothetical protein
MLRFTPVPPGEVALAPRSLGVAEHTSRPVALSVSKLWLQSAAALITALASPKALAEDTPLPIAVEYQAIEGCPPEGVFWTALSSRASRLQRSEVSGATATLRISVIVTPQGVLGRLQIIRRDRTTEPRFVEAASCGEVVEALALTAALSIEGEAALVPSSPEPRPLPPPDGQPVSPEDAYTEQQLPFDYVEPPNVSSSEDWETELHAHGIAAFIVEESASTGFGGMITFSRKRHTWAAQTLGLGVAGLSTALTDGDTQARFNLTQAAFIGCPVTLGEGVSLRPCAVFQIGILDASGKDISNPESDQGMWWAPGLGLFAETPTDGLLRLQFALQAVIPLTRQVYSMGVSRDTLTQTMSISPWLSVGLAMAP